MKPAFVYEPGTMLAGKYRVLGLLGTGGMGTVYDVLHDQIGKRRALKVLQSREALDTEALQRFQREMKADGAICNPHVVEVYDAGEIETGEPYVVLERLDGETLASLIQRKGVLDVDEICDLIGQTCAGVQAAHDAGIVHRDLKPANVFVTHREGKPFVKILDFGIAKFIRAVADDLTVTHEGTLLGTPCYMSPEQIRGKTDIDGRADVYALGVIMYECATGEVPYRAESMALLGVLICEGKPVPLGVLRGELSAEFRDCVARSMAVDRANRISSALELRTTLQRMTRRIDEDPVTGQMTVEPSGRDFLQRTEIIEERLELPAEKPSPVLPEKPPASPLPPWSMHRLTFAGMMIAIATSLMTAMLVTRVSVSTENDVPTSDVLASIVTIVATTSSRTTSVPLMNSSRAVLGVSSIVSSHAILSAHSLKRKPDKGVAKTGPDIFRGPLPSAYKEIPP
jgi:serine/threonine protein kinase